MRKSNYGIQEIIKNIFFLLRTFLFYRGARLIRFPIIIRGKKYIDFGYNLTTGYRCRIEVNGNPKKKILIFGENVNIGDYVRISCVSGIDIGNNVLIGSKVLIIDNSHGKYRGESQDSPDSLPNKRKLFSNKIKVEDNVWIGENSVIQQGVIIGKGSIIAANSVITSNVDAGVIVGGVPAKILKKYNEKENKWEKIK